MFFFLFFCLTLPRVECSRIRKAASFLKSHGVKKYKNLHWWNFTDGTKALNVENNYFLKVNFGFLLVIWVTWKQSVCSIILLYYNSFYSLFLPFFVLEIFKFEYDKFFVRCSASISKFKSFVFSLLSYWMSNIFKKHSYFCHILALKY